MTICCFVVAPEENVPFGSGGKPFCGMVVKGRPYFGVEGSSVCSHGTEGLGRGHCTHSQGTMGTL